MKKITILIFLAVFTISNAQRTNGQRENDNGLGQSLSQGIGTGLALATNLIRSKDDVQDTQQDTTQNFQDLTELIQIMLTDEEPESMEDVSGTIINALTERCDKEDSECNFAVRALIKLNERFFSQLDGLSNLIGEGSIANLILLLVKLNYGDSLEMSAVDLNTILKLVDEYSGDLLTLLQILKDLQHYLQEVNTNILSMKEIAPNASENNKILVGTLAVVIEVVEYWFLKTDKDDDNPRNRYVRGIKPESSILSSINGIEHEASDVSRVLQNAIFGYLSSKGDVKVAVAFSTMSFANIYGNFREK